MPKVTGGLRVGDRIRIVRLPAEWDQPGYFVHRDTRAVFRLLIKRGRGSKVYEIDEWGNPWIHCRTRHRSGGTEHHSLGLYERDCWVRVVPCGPGRKPANDM
jgi:hypothetical protein